MNLFTINPVETLITNIIAMGIIKSKPKQVNLNPSDIAEASEQLIPLAVLIRDISGLNKFIADIPTIKINIAVTIESPACPFLFI